MDDILLSLWKHADAKDLDEIVTDFPSEDGNPNLIKAGVACLAEAGLLTRIGQPGAQPVPEKITGPLVSAIIVLTSPREMGWLEECLTSLVLQSYSSLEIIVVDNATLFGLSNWLDANFPQARVSRLETLQPFARALNEGAASANGDYFLMLNPDLRLEQDAVEQMMRLARDDESCAAVAPKLRFSWAPSFINGLGNRVRSFAWGTDNGIGHLDLGQFDHWTQVPSACFAATLIPRKAWNAVGPVDEGFRAYYEDAEWCYRARLMGYTIRAAPKAVIYHVFGGWWKSPDQKNTVSPQKLGNVVYSRLRFVLKLVGRNSISRFLRNYLIEDFANVLLAFGKKDWEAIRAYLGAWKELWIHLPEILKKRRILQPMRATSDESLFAGEEEMPIPLVWNGLPELTWDLVIHHYFPLIRANRTRTMPELSVSNPRPHLLIVSHDVVDAKMAGPGMRYLEIARALCDYIDVTLAIPSPTSLHERNVRLVEYGESRPDSLRVLIENSDIALISGYMVQKFPFLAKTGTRLVVDLINPFFLENLHHYYDESLEIQSPYNDLAIDITNQLAQIGDFFICGSERQRDFWLGILAANRRINPRTYHDDATLRKLIDVVGFGIPDQPPARRKPVFRDAHPLFGGEVKIVWWGGGIWDWLDPTSLVRAWPHVIANHPEARLLFLLGHPNPLVPKHKKVDETLRLAEEIRERGRTIFFPEWLSYEDRESLLCEADVGAILHPSHLETHFSVRTRVLDFIWARLPILISSGDVMSDLVREHQLGRVAPPEDTEAVALALCDLLARPKDAWAQSFDRISETLRWSNVVKPLARYCQEGDYAPDRAARRTSLITEPARQVVRYNPLARGIHIWRSEGFRVFLRRAWRYTQWRLAQL